MNSKERMRLTMSGEKPDRVPVMCQLALGHIYKNAGIEPVDYWYDSRGVAEGFIQMSEKYKFDGILINIPGIDPELRSNIKSVDNTNKGHIINWKDGNKTLIPANDDPMPLINQPRASKSKYISIDELDLGMIEAIESEKQLPSYYLDIIDYIIAKKGNDLSIHGEVGTTFETFLNLLGSFEAGLMALLDDPEKCIKAMEIINMGVITKAKVQCSKGIDAMKLSSPLAGAGFISRDMYKQFVLPFENKLIKEIKKDYNIPCYVHTCGKIGDRLDLLVETGIDGIECLDPEPLGNAKLEKAVDEIGDKVFIKGNLDSVNELLGHTPEEVMEIARKRIVIGMKSPKGYILSSACSVSPLVPPENVKVLYDAVEAYGKY